MSILLSPMIRSLAVQECGEAILGVEIVGIVLTGKSVRIWDWLWS